VFCKSPGLAAACPEDRLRGWGLYLYIFYYLKVVVQVVKLVRLLETKGLGQYEVATRLAVLRQPRNGGRFLTACWLPLWAPRPQGWRWRASLGMMGVHERQEAQGTEGHQEDQGGPSGGD
jgi:hypothetical protein